jgi:hypothetical protein
MAILLARANKRVLAIDFDLEAPGAGAILPSASPAPYGVVDYLLEYPTAPPGAVDITEYYCEVDDKKVVGDGQPIAVVPAGTLDEWFLEKLARINASHLYKTASEDVGRSPLHALLVQLRSKVKPDIVLVDSRAGFHDLGGLTLSGLAHLQVMFGLRSEQSWQGLALAIAHLGKEMVLSGAQQRECAIVQTMTSPSGAVREDEVRRFKERSFEVFSANYYDSVDTEDAEWPVPDIESTEAPHYPAVLTWDVRISGYSSAADVASYLSEGDYLNLARLVLARVGKTWLS